MGQAALVKRMEAISKVLLTAMEPSMEFMLRQPTRHQLTRAMFTEFICLIIRLTDQRLNGGFISLIQMLKIISLAMSGLASQILLLKCFTLMVKPTKEEITEFMLT